MMHRRAFLAGMASVGAISAAGPALAVAAQRLPWKELARQLSGRLIQPGEPGFTEFALPNNLRYAAAQPAGIALCRNAQDVRASILWAREHDVPLVARSGGHSYAGYSTTNGLMIDLRSMNELSFHESTGIATLGGGAQNATFFAYFKDRNVAITHGRCPSVGIAGFTLGGGIGFNMRAHGLGCDQLVGTEIVTADGDIRQLHGNDELFWACRGAGGGNFGINTAFAFQTFDVGPMTFFDLTWKSDPERVFESLVDVLENAPLSLGAKLTVQAASATEGITIHLLGQCTDSPSKLRELFARAYAIGTPSGILARFPYSHVQRLLTEPGLPAYYQERSRFFNRRIDHHAIAAIFDGVRAYRGGARSAAFKVFLTGGRVNAKLPSETAFVHRHSEWLSSIELYWEEATPAHTLEQNLGWLDAFYASIVPIAGGGAYQNFIDPSLTDWKNAYHGTNLARLQAIKKRVDPTGVFTFAEAITA